jgi:hypothetical protein
MDIVRSWKRKDPDYYSCGPFSIHRERMRISQWVVYIEAEGQAIAKCVTLADVKAWLKANWRDLERQGRI